jgi:hypothetical protein
MMRQELDRDDFLQNISPLRQNGKHLVGLFEAVFDVSPVETVFATLTPRKKKC